MKKHSKHRLFYRYLCMFLLILILPVLIMGSVIQHNMRTALWTEVKTSTQAAAQQVVFVLEQNIISMEALATRLVNDPDIRIMAEAMKDPHATLVKKDGVQKLNMYIQANSFLQRIMVHENGELLSNEGFLLDNEAEAILAILKRTATHRFAYHPDLCSSAIYYIRKLTVQYSKGADLIIEIPRSTLVKQMHTLPHGSEMQVLIVEGENNIIFSTMEEAQIPQVLPHAQLGQWNELYWNQQDYMLYTTALERVNLQAIFLVPRHLISSPLNQVMKILGAYLLLSCLLGTLCSLWFSYRNYKPLQPILHDFEPMESGRGAGLEAISSLYDRTKRDNLELRGKVEAQKADASRHFLLNLLRGRYLRSADLGHMARQYGIIMEENAFRVLLLMGNTLPNYQRESLFEDHVRELFARYMNAWNHVCLVTEPGCMAVIVNYTASQTAEEKLIDIGLAMIDDILQQLSMNVTIGLSDEKPALVDLYQAYTEAESACEYRLLRGNNQLILYREVEDTPHDVTLRYMQSFRNQSDLQRHLENGNYDAVEQDINHLFEHIHNCQMSISLARCLYYEIINLVLRTLPYQTIKEMDLGRLLTMETMEGLKEHVLAIYRMACESRGAGASGCECRSHVEKAIDYIHAHYTENTLSSESVADNLGISRSYISRRFSQEMHIPISEYISRVRIQKASALLFDSSASLTHSAQQVGYSDLHTFLRNFKKFNGMTPTQYKEQKFGTKQKEKTE